MVIGTFGGVPAPSKMVGHFRHHAGSWNCACPHRRRAGMTVVPSPPCEHCVYAGEAAQVMSKSECGTFEFMLFKGQRVVVCTTCWRYGKPGQNHECHTVVEHPTEPWTITAHPEDEYQEHLLEVVGLSLCHACEGRARVRTGSRARAVVALVAGARRTLAPTPRRDLARGRRCTTASRQRRSRPPDPGASLEPLARPGVRCKVE